MIFSARATCPLRRVSLAVRSGRSISPHPEVIMKELRVVSSQKEASPLHIHLSREAGLSGTGYPKLLFR